MLKSIIAAYRSYVAVPTPEELRLREYQESQRQLLSHECAAEYHAAMAEVMRVRIARYAPTQAGRRESDKFPHLSEVAAQIRKEQPAQAAVNFDVPTVFRSNRAG